MTTKPKVLRIINRFNLGGPTYNASYLAKYMEDDFETLLIGGVKTEDEASSLYIAEDLGLKPMVINEMSRSIGLMSEIQAFQKISSIIKDFQPDIVHTHASKAGAIGRLAAKRNGVKNIVHTFHGHVFEHYFGPLKTQAVIQTERFLAKTCQSIVAISEKQKIDLVEKFKICTEEKCTVVPLGFELERFRENKSGKREELRNEFHISDNELVIGIIGRLAPIKNHTLFIKSVSELKNKGLKFRALIVGDGSEKEFITDLSTSLGLTINGPNSDLVFTSWRTDVDKILAAIDIVALTSFNEGTPVSLIEAQAAGKPVVSSRVGGVQDVVGNGKTGILFENNDLDGLTKSLEHLINNKSMRKEMGELGEQKVFDKYTANRLARDMKKLYFELLEK